MKWNIVDKMMISSILPEKGTLLTKVLCRDIKKKLEITPDEIKESSLESEEGKTTLKKKIDVDIEFTVDELNLLKENAARINSEGKVNDDNLELIEKLCG